MLCIKKEYAMDNMPTPIERLAKFREQLALAPRALEALVPYQERCAGKGGEFADFLWDFFMGIPQTRTILLHESVPGRLKVYWKEWFRDIFLQGPTDAFLDSLWKSGIVHVELSLDQRYINLGFALTRKFIHGMLQTEVPEEARAAGEDFVGAVLDLCLLVSTDSYVEGTTKCDREVIMGLAHQVRNPITIIGGYVQRLRKTMDGGKVECEPCDAILQEAHRLERMLIELGQYTEMFQRDPVLKKLEVKTLLESALKRAEKALDHKEITVLWDLSPGAQWIMADEKDSALLFEHLFLNALENMAGESREDRILDIGASAGPPGRPYLEIRIANTGPSPKEEEIPDLLRPFHSTKPMGTGFGLPIARLASHRSLGSLTLDVLPRGLRSRVSLPVPKAADLQNGG